MWRATRKWYYAARTTYCAHRRVDHAPCLSKFILMPGHHWARRARPSSAYLVRPVIMRKHSLVNQSELSINMGKSWRGLCANCLYAAFLFSENECVMSDLNASRSAAWQKLLHETENHVRIKYVLIDPKSAPWHTQ